MKHLSNSIYESLNINESGSQLVMAFDHDNPSMTYIIKNCNNTDVKKISKNMNVCSVDMPNGLALVQHSDEMGDIFSVGKNEQDMKKTLWGLLADNFDDENFAWMFYADEDEYKNVNDLWKATVDYIKQSEVDGDSGYGRALIDLSKNNVILSGGLEVVFYDSPAEFLEDFE